MGGKVANHSSIIEDLKPELTVWLRQPLRERTHDGWFDSPRYGRPVLDLFSKLADFIGSTAIVPLVCCVGKMYHFPATCAKNLQKEMSPLFASTGAQGQQRLCWRIN
jgi:hypothetical protein